MLLPIFFLTFVLRNIDSYDTDYTKIPRWCYNVHWEYFIKHGRLHKDVHRVGLLLKCGMCTNQASCIPLLLLTVAASSQWPLYAWAISPCNKNKLSLFHHYTLMCITNFNVTIQSTLLVFYMFLSLCTDVLEFIFWSNLDDRGKTVINTGRTRLGAICFGVLLDCL